MTDQTDAPAPAPSAAPVKLPTDWPTLTGVIGIAGIAMVAIGMSPGNSHDVALSAISALAGWMSHKALNP